MESTDGQTGFQTILDLETQNIQVWLSVHSVFFFFFFSNLVQINIRSDFTDFAKMSPDTALEDTTELSEVNFFY